MNKFLLHITSLVALVLFLTMGACNNTPKTPILLEAEKTIEKQPDSALNYLAYIIHSGFISGYQNRYGDNLKPPTNVYHRMTA